MMPEERREHRHWKLTCRVFGFRDCRDAGAARAAAVLGHPRDELRMHVGWREGREVSKFCVEAEDGNQSS